MAIIRFQNDYSQGAHPAILRRIAETNDTQYPGYGMDECCEAARALIKARCEKEEIEVQFIQGGTPANLTVIAAALRPHQGVVSCDTGHIAAHETGAIEGSGHKVITVPHADGKLTAAQVEAVWEAHLSDGTREHIVQPKMVYLSHPTEFGTLYTREELTAIAEVTHRYGGYLYIDGARLGYGLTAPGADVDLPLLARLCDAFTIGGTKQGMLFGEAIVLMNPAISDDFRYILKQRGGMLAKGWLLGLQFETMFADDLYFEAAAHANRMAARLRDALAERNIPLAVQTCANQTFAVLPNKWIEATRDAFDLSYWGAAEGDCSVMRICTSWATREEDIETLIAALPRN
jgi:threonine aldolase